MNIYILFALFQLKHFLADYILQTEYHLKKFLPSWKFFDPLLNHCITHAGFTVLLVLFVNPNMLWLAPVDLVAHFIMDRIKAGPKYLGRFKSLSANEYKDLMWPLQDADEEEKVNYLNSIKPILKSNKYFWWSVGFDQMFHHLTDLFIVYMLTKG